MKEFGVNVWLINTGWFREYGEEADFSQSY